MINHVVKFDPPVIQYRSSAFATNALSDSVVIDKPAGTVSGDVLIAIVNVNNSSSTINPPAGWVLISNHTAPFTANIATYYTICGEAEPGSYTFSFSASQRNSGGIACYVGVDNVNPINTSNSQGNSETTEAPSITPSVSGCMLIYANAYDNGTTETYTEPAGYTLAYQSSGSAGNMQAYKLQAAAAPTGTVSAAMTTIYGNAAFNIALNPA